MGGIPGEPMARKDWQAEYDRMQERGRKSRAILGITEKAGAAEIRRAFRRASIACHPDRNEDDAEASRRFHLVRCAYKFLTEGEACAALDELESPPAAIDGDYRLDNPWGYWCWWRDKYF